MWLFEAGDVLSTGFINYTFVDVPGVGKAEWAETDLKVGVCGVHLAC